LGIGAEVFYAAALAPALRGDFLARVAPTEHCEFRGRVVRGEVHDENCAAYGGIAGHAGMFGRADAVLDFGLAMLDALAGRSCWLDQALVRWAVRPRPGGGHVVGWDTPSAQGASAGSLFSLRSFGHLGFTGTSIWCDPTRGLCAVLLSNRVHPTRENIRIRTYRPRFHDAIVRMVFGD
jgi:CubicO group peptidase (beta-lactamase class C family)